MNGILFHLRRNSGKVRRLLMLTILGNFIVFNIYHLQYWYLNDVTSMKADVITLSNSYSDFNTIRRRNVTITSQEAEAVNISEKIDWNNYTLMSQDLVRTGLGEQGISLHLLISEKDKEREKSLYDQFQFNVMVSSTISYQRSIGDSRDRMCKKAKFIKHIPTNSVSIVIPFYNEHNSTILRTVFSIINRTPPILLRELILVDDFSTLPELKLSLEEFIKSNNLKKVRILRNKQRLGLIRSRIAGADISSGRFLVFLESHMEVNYNYLPPLIEPIMENSKTVTCPTVDNINRHNFGIVKIEYERNAFDWNLQNKHFPIFPEDAKNLPSPVATPVMMGGAFAIDRKWWETIGKYDPGLEVWGGEQYEISFKIWMCGGEIVNVPCSRVAHLFKYKLPYPVGEKYARNLKRVVSVWMDDYSQYVYQRLPGVRDAQPGDLSSRVALRQRLQCKDFDWYMKNVAHDILSSYPVIEPPNLAWGALRPKLKQDFCVKFSPADQNNDIVFVDKCGREGNEFVFNFSWRKVIQERNGIRCFETRQKEKVSVHYMRLNATVQQFVWSRQSGWIISVASGLCLFYNETIAGVDMRQCSNLPAFSWTFDHYNSDVVDGEWNTYQESQK